MKSYSPLRYPGGKSQMYDQVISIFEANNIENYSYAEPFAGGAGIAIRLLLENKVRRIYINDLDKSIYCFWKAITLYSTKFIDMINDCEITIDEWEKQKIIQKNKDMYDIDIEDDILELAFSTFFLNRTNRSGIITAGPIGGKKQNGNYLLDCRFNKEKLVELIALIANKSNRISVTRMDAKEFIEFIKYQKKIFLFIDPPYYKKGESLYFNSLTHDGHVEIEKTIRKKLKNKKWIVTYDMCNEIKSIYSKHEYIENPLRYSLNKKTNKKEYLFFRNIQIE